VSPQFLNSPSPRPLAFPPGGVYLFVVMKVVDPESYKRGMRQLAASVTIVTTAHEGQRRGLTATAVCSLSAGPPTLLVCVNRLAAAHDLIVAGGRFCVNVLAEEHAKLSRRFAGAETGEARFSAGTWEPLTTGAPALREAMASFDCELLHQLPVETHSVFIGRVVDVVSHPGRRPLLYADGCYVGLGALPAIMADQS
jgi:flavin reductase (DIM6/NTAB) family NADH-FMN oxidoreductase RutF